MRQAGPSVVDIIRQIDIISERSLLYGHGPINLDTISRLRETGNDLYIQIAALAALINEPKLKKASWVKKNVKSQLIDTQHRCYKGNIWKKIAKKEIGLASLGNIASLLTSRDNVSLELTTSSKLRQYRRRDDLI